MLIHLVGRFGQDRDTLVAPARHVMIAEHACQNDVRCFVGQNGVEHAGVVAAQIHAPADNALSRWDRARCVNGRATCRKRRSRGYNRCRSGWRISSHFGVHSMPSLPNHLRYMSRRVFSATAATLLDLLVGLVMEDAEVRSFRDLPAFLVAAQMPHRCLCCHGRRTRKPLRFLALLDFAQEPAASFAQTRRHVHRALNFLLQAGQLTAFGLGWLR